jgi:hypothetical protein
LRISLVGVRGRHAYIGAVAVQVGGTAVISAIRLRRETKR